MVTLDKIRLIWPAKGKTPRFAGVFPILVGFSMPSRVAHRASPVHHAGGEWARAGPGKSPESRRGTAWLGQDCDRLLPAPEAQKGVYSLGARTASTGVGYGGGGVIARAWWTVRRSRRATSCADVRPCRGAPWLQPVAAGRKSRRRESREIKRKSLPWVASRCEEERMVRRGSAVQVRQTA